MARAIRSVCSVAWRLLEPAAGSSKRHATEQTDLIARATAE